MRMINYFIRPFTRSIFLKLILIHTIMITLTISVSGYLIISNISDVLQDKEIKFEGEALKKLKGFTEEEYDKIYKIVIQMNYPGGIGDVIAKAGTLQDKLYSNDNSIRKIKDYLSTICSYDDNIADFIVVSNDQTIFYDTGFTKQARTAIVSYPFLEDQWIKGVIANKEFVKVIRDNPSRYIYKGSEDVISFVGNIYDPTHIEKKQLVGAYIINVSLDRFTKSYTEYESSVKGDFVLSNAEGNVLYSSDKNFVLDPSKNLDSVITPLPDHLTKWSYWGNIIFITNRPSVLHRS